MAEFNVAGRLDETSLRLECSGSLVYDVSTQAREQVRAFLLKFPLTGNGFTRIDRLQAITFWI